MERFFKPFIRICDKPIYFPALVFLVVCLTSFATGTSYGTMAILIPMAIPVAYGLDGSQDHGIEQHPLCKRQPHAKARISYDICLVPALLQLVKTIS